MAKAKAPAKKRATKKRPKKAAPKAKARATKAKPRTGKKAAADRRMNNAGAVLLTPDRI